MDRDGRNRTAASAAHSKAGWDPRRSTGELPSAHGPVSMSAAEYYQEQEMGDLCYLPAPIGKHMRVRSASLTPSKVILHDNHGQRFELAHDDHVTLIERED